MDVVSWYKWVWFPVGNDDADQSEEEDIMIVEGSSDTEDEEEEETAAENEVCGHGLFKQSMGFVCILLKALGHNTRPNYYYI